MNIDFAIEFTTKKFKAVGVENHFLRVLAVLQDEFHVVDEELLIAAVLHDTLEDTDTTYEELEQIFSKPVADLVAEVTHIKNYNKEQKLEFYKRLRNISPKAKILKMADAVDNLRDEIRMMKENQETPYNYLYAKLLLELMASYPESSMKDMVLQLINELQTYEK
jgi:(p)ppGpp synthase/HD superfamily hydrolase